MDNRRIDRIKATLNFFSKNNGLVSVKKLGNNDVRFTYKENLENKILTFRIYLIDSLNVEESYTKAFILLCEDINVPLVYQDLIDEKEFDQVCLDKFVEDFNRKNAVKEQIEKELDDVF